MDRASIRANSSGPRAADSRDALRAILWLRGHKVLLDADLATLYGVETKVLLQAVRRNLERFPQDFMIQLTAGEWRTLRSQIVPLKGGPGQHRKYLPYAFTEQGVAMLSSVLNSHRAIAVNIEIMRAFVRMREMLASNKDLARKLDELERKLQTHDRAIVDTSGCWRRQPFVMFTGHQAAVTI
jgi:ORF6N domain